MTKNLLARVVVAGNKRRSIGTTPFVERSPRWLVTIDQITTGSADWLMTVAQLELKAAAAQVHRSKARVRVLFSGSDCLEEFHLISVCCEALAP